MSAFITSLFIDHPILFLAFLVAGICGIKFGLAALTTPTPGEEMKISIVATDKRTGKPLYMKVVHPGKVLEGRFLKHLHQWLGSVKATCEKEGHDFALTAKIILPPSVKRTPEFEKLLEQYGLDPQHSVMAGPAE